MPGNGLNAKNELFKFLYNNRTFIKALPVGKYIAEQGGVDFPSNRKGDSFCYLHLSDTVITELNSLKNKYEIDFAPHSCHLTVYANIDFSAPATTKPTLCHFTIKFTHNKEAKELRLYYSNDGDMVLHDGCNDEVGKAIVELPIVKSMQKDFAELLAKLHRQHLA